MALVERHGEPGAAARFASGQWPAELRPPVARLVREWLGIAEPAVGRRQVSGPDRAFARARSYLAKMQPSVAGAGGDDQLFSAAIALVRGFRLSEPEAMELLRTEFNPRCQPPWPDARLLYKIKQAYSSSEIPFGHLLDGGAP